MADDDKWILYNNMEWNRSGQAKWTTTNHSKGPFSKKVMMYGEIERESFFYELLLKNLTINSNKYCFQLDQLKSNTQSEKLLELVNRKPIIFHQDNGRPYVSLNTRQKLLQHGSEVLIHLTCSLDIAPSDLNLFQS